MERECGKVVSKPNTWLRLQTRRQPEPMLTARYDCKTGAYVVFSLGSTSSRE